MSQTLITNIIYVVVVLVSLVAEHYNILPAGTAFYALGIVTGHALDSGTLVPQPKQPAPVSTPVTPSNGTANTTVVTTGDNTRG